MPARSNDRVLPFPHFTSLWMHLFRYPVAMMAGFMILGAILSMGKCSCLIAGCNMMNRGQKKQYDEQALCRFMGKIMYCLAFAMLIWLASIILQNSVLLSASLYFLVGSIAFAVIYAGTGRRFKK